MQPHQSRYYEEINREFGLHHVPIRPGQSLRARLSASLLGVPAVFWIDRLEILAPLFDRLSEQAMAAFYVVKSNSISRLQMETWDGVQLQRAVIGEPSHFCYQVDEDSATEDGTVTVMTSVGAACEPALREVVDEVQ